MQGKFILLCDLGAIIKFYIIASIIKIIYIFRSVITTVTLFCSMNTVLMLQYRSLACNNSDRIQNSVVLNYGYRPNTQKLQCRYR